MNHGACGKEALLGPEELEDLFIRLGSALKKPATITIIGGAVCMHLGRDRRMTMDVDVWKRDSHFDLADMKQACEAAGVDFNPRDVAEPVRPYLQIVEQGIVQLGRYAGTTELATTGNLTICRPPLENIVASKMVRGEDRDYDDSAFLIARAGLSKARVEAAISSIEDDVARETAAENMTVLALVAQFRKPAVPTAKASLGM